MAEEQSLENKAIKGGRLIDGTGAEPIDNATVIIEGSKIKAVGKNIEIPKGIKVIDATGKTVMPGLIDSHLHLGGWMSDATYIEKIIRPKELSLIKSINDCKTLLAAGFTTFKDCGSTNAVFLKKAVAEGTLTGVPRLVVAGYVLCQTYGRGDLPYLPLECVDPRTCRHAGQHAIFLICDGVDECIKTTRYALRFGADFIKILASGSTMSIGGLPSDTEFNPDEIKAIVQTTAQVGKFVSAHCQNSRAAKNTILGGVKTIEHGNETNDEVIEMAKEHGIVFVSCLGVTRVFIDSGAKFGMTLGAIEATKTQWDLTVDTYKRIRKAGAILATGPDYGGSPSTPLGANAIELELLVKHCDFTPMEAIVAATKNGAIACFMGDKTGTIEPGKFADIIVVDGDPLGDIRILQDVEKIKLVILEGKVEIDRGQHQHEIIEG
jgi:imidazolonepropionase-like amidohydrolase